MARKLLIANRGEIVLRIIKTCEKIGGFAPCAVFSEADKNALYLRKCSDTFAIGGLLPSESYLRIDKMIEAAEKMGCDIVHPGYGFLAENAAFSAACSSAGLAFVGPNAETLGLTGDKAKAKQVGSMVAPTLQGKEVTSEIKATELAQEIGYPVIVKAVRGGGGRGLRVARSREELQQAFGASQKEAMLSFGSGRLYIERYLERPRHIEVQVIADDDKAIHLGERECSVQRRHQKLIEETPSLALTPDKREELLKTAIALMKAVRYKNAGTVEFLFDAGRFYFMEVNARVQVEHPITEQVTGVDIVEQQLRVASGEGLGVSQDGISFSGHAIECRINAEHPFTFAPHPGIITKFLPPGKEGARIDTAAYPGYSVPPFYDSLIAKLVCHSSSRSGAIEKMKEALMSFQIGGIPTTIPFHLSALNDNRFVEGNYDTSFVDGLKPFAPVEAAVAAAVMSLLPKRIRFVKAGAEADRWAQARYRAIADRRISGSWGRESS